MIQHLVAYRYDGRGHLYDLRPYDAEFVDSNNFVQSEKEKALEKACDEERYLELHTDVLTKQMYEGMYAGFIEGIIVLSCCPS